MELRRQRCQQCQSIDLRNILRRAEGKPMTVFVRCAQCHALVARYELAAYYHHGKGLESWLRGLGGTALESGRDTLARFEDVKGSALEEYDSVLAQLQRENKEV